MRTLHKATRTTQRALGVAKVAIQLTHKMKQANGKTRLKIIGKLLGLITIGIGAWFIRETWKQAQQIDVQKDAETMMRDFFSVRDDEY